MSSYRLVSHSGEHTFDCPPGKVFVLGRATGTDFPVQDPTISRRHAELEGTPNGVRVKDLGSSNGTFANGAKLEEKVIAAGETVRSCPGKRVPVQDPTISRRHAELEGTPNGVR